MHEAWQSAVILRVRYTSRAKLEAEFNSCPGSIADAERNCGENFARLTGTAWWRTLRRADLSSPGSNWSDWANRKGHELWLTTSEPDPFAQIRFRLTQPASPQIIPICQRPLLQHSTQPSSTTPCPSEVRHW